MFFSVFHRIFSMSYQHTMNRKWRVINTFSTSRKITRQPAREFFLNPFGSCAGTNLIRDFSKNSDSKEHLFGKSDLMSKN